MTAIKKPFTMDALAKPKQSAKVAPAKKPTKHGLEVVRMLKELRKCDWDEAAMRRA